MKSGYFDVKSDANYGFTIRIHYEESIGVVSITDIQLQTTVYGGGSQNGWFIDGTIKVGDQTVLDMDFNNPATHVFNVFGASDVWKSIAPINSGTTLPVVATAILDKASAEISVDITLYRDSSTIKPKLSGSATIELSTGFVYIDNGDGYEPYMAYIDNGTSWDRYIPYIDNGTSWDICS